MPVPKVIFDYSKLEARISVMGFTHGSLAMAIGISAGTMSSKMRGKPFSQDEIWRIQQALKISDRELSAYFFDGKVQKNEHKQPV